MDIYANLLLFGIINKFFHVCGYIRSFADELPSSGRYLFGDEGGGVEGKGALRLVAGLEALSWSSSN